MNFSAVGKKKVAAHVVLLLVNAIVLALSTRINQYQEFFYIADLFPFAMSILTAVLLTIMLVVDFCFDNSYTGRPQFEIGVFSVMSIFWLAFNAFSTSRWSQVPMTCGAIPAEYTDVRVWCHELQALKAFVWIEWVIFFCTALTTLRYSITQNSRGNHHVFKMPLSRYSPTIRSDHHDDYPRNSEFVQYEFKM